MIKYIDTHCHIQFNAYKEDSEEVIHRALEGGVGMITVGTQKDTSRRAVEWAEKNPNGLWAAVGLHPTHLFDEEINEEVEGEEVAYKTKAEDFDVDFYKKLCASPRVVAIGEVGLDYWHRPSNVDAEDFRRKQLETFEREVALAKEVNLPLILHVRPSSWETDDAYDDLYNILKNYPPLTTSVPSGRGMERRGGVLHCYTGNWEIAKKFLDLGYYIGFTGVITFPPAKVAPILETVKNCPPDRILSETDAPYLSPVPFRGKRNEPVYVKYIVAKIAELRGADPEKTAEQLLSNASDLFNIKI